MHPAHTPETPAPDTAAASARAAAAVASSTPDAGARCAPLIGWDIGGAHVKASLLEAGTVAERVITVAELFASPRVFLINSVRGWMPATVMPR